MVQIILKTELKQKDNVLIIPENEEIQEIQEGIKEKIKKTPRKKFFKKYSKSHEKKMDINRLKNHIDAKIYRGGFTLR